QYREALRINPADVLGLSNLAVAQYRKGRFDEAIIHYRAVTKLKPLSGSAHVDLGVALHRSGKLDDAIEHYLLGVRLEPGQPGAHSNLAIALLDKRRFQEARAELVRSLELFPAGDSQRRGIEAVLRDCDRKIALEARLPAILQGKDKPANAEEGLELAQICYAKKRFLAAARLFAESAKGAARSFAAPGLSHRYNAACAAAMVGCGYDVEAAEISNDERTEWRKQALTWL